MNGKRILYRLGIFGACAIAAIVNRNLIHGTTETVLSVILTGLAGAGISVPNTQSNIQKKD